MLQKRQRNKRKYTKIKSLPENWHWKNDDFSAEYRTNEESAEISKISNLIEKADEKSKKERLKKTSSMNNQETEKDSRDRILQIFSDSFHLQFRENAHSKKEKHNCRTTILPIPTYNSIKVPRARTICPKVHVLAIVERNDSRRKRNVRKKMLIWLTCELLIRPS